MISSRFEIVKNLGKGASGEVKLVFDTQTKRFYACKIYNQDKNSEINFYNFQKECQILSVLKHKHII